MMNVPAFLLPLFLSLVLSFDKSHGEDSLSISSLAATRFESLPLIKKPVFNTPKRTQRATKPETQSQPLEQQSLPLNDTYKIVCYYTNYAWYRSGVGKFSLRDIDPQLCTHVVYGFAVLDQNLLVIKPGDNWADIENKHYEKIMAINKRGVKVSIALGGWGDSAGDKYSRMVNSPTSRRRFIEHLLQFMYEHGFDGLELDWEFPKCWQLDCSKGPESDKNAFSVLVQELREAFNPHGFLLSAAVTSLKQPTDAGYNIKVLSENLDWISMKTYDYHGHWKSMTGNSAPLYPQPDDDDVTLTVNFTINYWLSQGADKHKLILGIPMFGNSFKLKTVNDNGLHAYTIGPGDSGEQSSTPGILTYYEICERVRRRGWEVVRDPKGSMEPYARHGDQWVSFDDPAMVQRKSEYVIQNNLGGVMIFSLDYDDFRNICGSGKYPLLRAINTVLRNYSDPGLDSSSVVSRDQTTTERRTTEQQTTSTTAAPQTAKVVCLFTSWSSYRQKLGKFLPQNIDSSLCTHIVYAFSWLDSKSLTVKPQDKWADLDNDFYGQVVRLKQKGVKILLGVGGWEDSKGDKYSRLVNDPDTRARFVTHLSEYLREYGFDGVSLNWEYPTCWQMDCNAGPASDKEGFAALVAELSQELKPRGLLLSADISHSNLVIENGFDVKTLAKHLDWFELKAFDYNGYWNKRTGHGSPLYYTEGDISPYMNVNFSVHYLLGAGAPREKVVLRMPLYGQTHTLEDPSQFGLGAPVSGPGSAGDYTISPGVMAFYEICKVVRGEGWKIDKSGVGTVAHYGTQWISYDDISDVQRKAQFIKDLGLGGAMVWALDYDDFNNNCGCGSYPLLNVLNQSLLGPSTSETSPAVGINCTAEPKPTSTSSH